MMTVTVSEGSGALILSMPHPETAAPQRISAQMNEADCASCDVTPTSIIEAALGAAAKIEGKRK